MNNNRNSNNNRRGRGRPNTNRSQGGGNQANRIDSRARGNAPQLLDKYKKLAQDAQHNGDRVQAEYYLQFADHYFRVLADNKARQDEARAKRPDDRGESSSDDDDSDDRGGSSRRSRGYRNDGDDNDSRDDSRDNRDRSENRGRGDSQSGRGKRRSNRDDDDRGSSDDNFDHDNADRDNSGDRDENPFIRGKVSSEAKRPRKPRVARPVRDADEIDASALPPAIGGGSDEEPKPKRAPRRRKIAEDGEAATAAG